MNINLKILSFVLALFACAFAVMLGVAVGTGEYFAPSIVAGTFGALALLSSPHFTAALAFANYFSALTLPDIPGQMRLFDVLVLLLGAIFLLQAVMRRKRAAAFSWLDWVVIAFSGWIFFLGMYRGFGFLVFGSDMMGGFNYMRLLLTASLVITLPRVGITERGWKPAILFLGLLAPTALVSDLLISRGGHLFDFIQFFLQPSASLHDMETTADADSGSTLQRLWAAGPASTGMLLSLLCLVPMRRFFQPTGAHWLFLFGAIVCLSLLSGFRLMTATLFLIAALTLFLQKGFTAPRITLLVVACSACLVILYLFAIDLPLSAQRAISWLPYIDVNATASGDAGGTVDWRLRLWHEAARDIPDYWLIGKGFSYNKANFIASLISNDDLRWALLTGSYHNGWLSMLLCTGVIGALFCLTIMGGSIWRHWKRHRAEWNNSALKRFHGVFLASLIANVVVFVVVYGDVHASFPGIFFNLAVLETLLGTDLAATRTSDEEESPEPAESTYQEA